MMQTILPKFADYPQHLHALAYYSRAAQGRVHFIHAGF